MVKVPPKYQVLIVEDEPEYANPLTDILKASKLFDVLDVTASASEAWQIIQDKTPDAVIVDLELEEGDGFELLCKVRGKDAEYLQKIPYMLVLTKFDSDKVIARVQQLADFFRRKNEHYTPIGILTHLENLADGFGVKIKKKLASTEEILERKQKKLEAERNQVLRGRIYKELDKYYMHASSQARDYLAEVLLLALKQPRRQRLVLTKIYEQVSDDFERELSTITMSIDKLLKKAFSEGDEDELLRNFPPYAKMAPKPPTNKEFITYLVEEIRFEEYKNRGTDA